MRTAVNATTWTGVAKATGSSLELDTFLREAAAAGYEGVELGAGLVTESSRCRELLAEHELGIASFFASVTYNPHPPATDAFRQACTVAAALGAPVLTVCGGFLPNNRRTTYDFDYDIFAGNLHEHARIAADQGLVIAFHPHRGCIVETADETARLIERAPEIRLCIDTGHLVACHDDPAAAIRRFDSYIVSMHLKEWHANEDRFTELGMGDGSTPACLQALHDIGYDSWLTVELDRHWRDGVDYPAVESARVSRDYLRQHGI